MARGWNRIHRSSSVGIAHPIRGVSSDSSGDVRAGARHEDVPRTQHPHADMREQFHGAEGRAAASDNGRAVGCIRARDSKHRGTGRFLGFVLDRSAELGAPRSKDLTGNGPR